METHNDKELEKFTQKLMKETSPEQPSADFTSKVMFEVLATKISNATVYKPLISKRAWFIIIAVMLLFMAYLLGSENALAGNRFNWFGFFDKRVTIFDNLPVMKFSEVSLYAVVLATIMLFVQIRFIMRYFNKRFES